jgi:transposase
LNVVNGAEEVTSVPKPTKTIEVVPTGHQERRQRRKFSAEEKARILQEADACERGQLGALLRREGIYDSHLASWRAQRDRQGQAGLQGRKPGPKPRDAKDRIIKQLQRKTERLEKELRVSKAVIDLQIKAHEILGIALPKIEDNDEGASSSSSSSVTRRSR